MESSTVYILSCADGKIYTGCSKNFAERLNLHQAGKIKFTRTRLPVSGLLPITFYDKHKTFAFEKYFKSGSGRAFSKRRFNRDLPLHAVTPSPRGEGRAGATGNSFVRLNVLQRRASVDAVTTSSASSKLHCNFDSSRIKPLRS